ncbi:MAG: RNA polymerase sigma factor [Anaerolineae bacterium]|nr:RNA polymerase sigma factor [Anaerolineae bacterium]
MIDDTELLRRVRLQDESALTVIFDTYYLRIYRYIYHHVHHQQTAEDLSAEVFVKFTSEIAKGRGPKRHLTGWLYRVAHNIVIDEARRFTYRDHERLGEAIQSEDADVEGMVEDIVLLENTRQALLQLTYKQRIAIILKYLEGMENEEIARILKVSVGAVKSRLHLGLAAMRRYLKRTKSI